MRVFPVLSIDSAVYVADRVNCTSHFGRPDGAWILRASNFFYRLVAPRGLGFFSEVRCYLGNLDPAMFEIYGHNNLSSIICTLGLEIGKAHMGI